MLDITKLLCGSENFGDRLRYASGAAHEKSGTTKGKGPVVVWNCTNSCNLKCRHCYADSENKKFEGELDLKEAKYLIEDLAKLKVPVILISGGEPLMRDDLFEIINYAKNYNIRTTISTNGTLIDKKTAQNLKKNGVNYVGISLDGIGANHDKFRGVAGSFNKSLDGIRNCMEIGQKVGLRFTINKSNYNELEDIFYLIKEEKIPRVCFYHLAYSGRGNAMASEDITSEQKRQALDLIMNMAVTLGKNVEILTVGNHADAVYLYLQVERKYPHLKDKVWDLLHINGGNRSGMALANIDFKGYVHADQFTQQHSFGNIRERKFSDIWKNPSNSMAIGLRNRKPLLKGRCGSCKWIDVCNGNLRVRAEAATGDFWDSDPSCYLTDEEIGILNVVK